MIDKKAKELNKNFWQGIKKPFFVMAPMANVTDYAFRQIISKYGKPDVMWTEFVSADGLNSRGKEKLLIDLKFSKNEKPIVAQLFTGHPDEIRKAAKLVAELGFDGLDINMGCPDRAVLKQGGGAAIMKNQEVAIEVLKSAREGWMEERRLNKRTIKQLNKKTNNNERFTIDESESFDLPVTIKTRIGYNKIEIDWIRLLLEQKLPALTIHLRTRKEMSDVPAHWELMPEIVKMRDEICPETLIIGNGDVESVEDGQKKIEETGCDGVMIGRGIFGRPWIFQKSNHKNQIPKTPQERLKIMLEHAKLFDKTFCGKKQLKNFSIMKKHFKAYVSGWDGAKELRVKLMETDNFKEVKKIVDEYILSFKN